MAGCSLPVQVVAHRVAGEAEAQAGLPAARRRAGWRPPGRRPRRRRTAAAGMAFRISRRDVVMVSSGSVRIAAILSPPPGRVYDLAAPLRGGPR